MRISEGRRALSWGVAVVGFWAQPGFAQDMVVQAINEAAIVDVPFVLDKVSPDKTGSTLWVKGDRPPNLLLAEFTIRPVQSAKLTSAATQGDGQLLWRAFVGGGIKILRADELDLVNGPRYFCGAALGRPLLLCYIDKDGNGSFDQVAEALSEMGSQPYHVTVIKGAIPLTPAQPYQIVADAQRPTINVALRNCGKDYDRPRFSALSPSDGNIWIPRAALEYHTKDSSFASCRRGRQIAAPTGLTTTVPNGGYVGEIGPLAFTVGPKQNPQLTLLGPVDPQALYRLEASSLIDIGIGRTPAQARLLAAKKFPYPALITDEGAKIHDGQLPIGGLLATVPFRYAYRGKLTQDISISRLFGKRSLPAGTIVYGFPAQGRIERTVNGVPNAEAVDDEQYRKINLELTWCAPVHTDEPAQQEPKGIGRAGWSAACIPGSPFGTYTILPNLQPAFLITGVSYAVGTVSNEGTPPIQRDDTVAFERPLMLRYLYQGNEAGSIKLEEQVYFGEQLTSSKPFKLFAPSGKIAAIVGGASVELAVGVNNQLSVRSTSAPVIGSRPLLRWDQRPFLIEEFKKMRVTPPDLGDKTGPIFGSTDAD